MPEPLQYEVLILTTTLLVTVLNFANTANFLCAYNNDWANGT